MNERLHLLRQRALDRAYAPLRRPAPASIAEECADPALSWVRQRARVMRRLCEAEQPVIAPEERIVFTRTVLPLRVGPSQEVIERLQAEGRWEYRINNICADWPLVLEQGLLGRRETALATRERLADDPETVEFLDSAIGCIDAVLALAARYAEAAREMGRDDIAGMLAQVPARRPRTFHEALQSLRLCHAMIWVNDHELVGLGRFDQYMWPYLDADLQSGRLTMAAAEELLAEFFITLNRDSDLYTGIQVGDNGQTIMLGGVTRDGGNAVNPLTYMALRASRDLAMIDPKINLRITRDTELELLCLGTELTRKGMGFPQYSNDDLVIPALAAHGYELEDARDYGVAACWEYIIPGKGLEVVNIGAVSFPAAADTGIREGLAAGDDFAGILRRVRESIHRQVRTVVDHNARLEFTPAPYFSILMDGCLERGRDLSAGERYNNFGIHGACSANAADALAAVQQLVFVESRVQPDELLRALGANFAGYETLRHALQNDAPKVGNHDDTVDALLTRLFDDFADACESLPGGNGRGGIVRPGTGSAMFYVWLANPQHDGLEPTVGATADGRKVGDYFSANLAPAPGVFVRGPISVLQTYSKIDYPRIYNGGPITLEFSDAVFRDDEAIHKVAMFIRTFAQLGCQQLQLNTVNYETLLDAKAHPDRHRNLIVRVWGWSGYFCELTPEYQDHVIARHRYGSE